MLDDRFRKELNVTEDDYGYISWLSYSELGSSNYIKRGYFLEEEIRNYEEDEEHKEPMSAYFTEMLTENAYIRLLQKDKEEAMKYSYYCMFDIYSIEYETSVIKKAVADLAEDIDLSDVVIICSQG